MVSITGMVVNITGINIILSNKDSLIDIRITKDWYSTYQIDIMPSDFGKKDTMFGFYIKRLHSPNH